MQGFLNMLNDPKVLLGIAILIILFIVFIFAAFPSKPKREPKPKQDSAQEKRTFSAEALVHELLSDRRWRLTPLDQIAEYVGGYKDDELRQLLVRAGAVRFSTKNGANEMWGLLERNRRKLYPGAAKDAVPEEEPKATLLKPRMPKIFSQTAKMPIFGSGAQATTDHDMAEAKTEEKAE